MGQTYKPNLNATSFLVTVKKPIDVRTVVDSIEDLTNGSIQYIYRGLVVNVRGTGDLYVLISNPPVGKLPTMDNWAKVGGADLSDYFKFDGTSPTSGNGISIVTNSENAFVEDVYVDDYFHADVYYSSHGINSSKDNGGSELDGVTYIRLSNGSESYIELYDDGTMKFNIVDDSLGFNLENIIGYIDELGVEHINPFEGEPYQTGSSLFELASGSYIKFDKDIDFTGFTETRDGDSYEYTFGQTGSNYEDIDFYTSNILPTVYAYSDNTSVKVLTDGDKAEILNKIDMNEVEPIPTEDIMDLF